MSVSNRQYLRREERRQQILAAALRVFVQGGYHGTHVSQIVREAGVARGTFYLHFKSKHEVFAALVARMLEVFLSLPVEDELCLGTPAGARGAMERSYRSFFELLRSERRLCRLLLEEAVGLDKGFRAALEAHYLAWHARIRGTLVLLVEHGVARADLDVDVGAELVIGMVERVVRRYLLPPGEPDLERLVRAVVDFELLGVAGAPR